MNRCDKPRVVSPESDPAIFEKDLLTIAEENQPRLAEELINSNVIKDTREEINEHVCGIEDMPFEEVEKVFLKMLDDIERQIGILHKRIDEIKAKKEAGEDCLDSDLTYFEYPYEEFFMPFKEEVLRQLAAKQIPNIGTIGYGSLNSAASAKTTMVDPHVRELVTTEDLQRGLFLRHYSIHATRKENFWAEPGSTQYDETGEMAVRYKKGQQMNGVRLSNLSLQNINNLQEREFPYFMLPCGPSTTDDEETYALNLVCWPIGNELTRTLKADKWEKFMALPMFDRDENESKGKRDKEVVQTAHAVHFNGLKPDIHYVETCLDIGDTRHEEMFLDTTFVPMPEGDPITLREYLAKYAPANNPNKREYFGERVKERIYVWNKDTSKWELEEETPIKAIERFLACQL